MDKMNLMQNMIFKNILTFINGKYVGGSAVIVNSKNIVFDKCIFENNTRTNNGGGAFATEWDQHAAEGLTIKNCIFRGNKAPASSGAVACFSTNFKIINTIFENNYASNTIGRTAYEGALQAGMTNTYGLISNCTFRNNYAKSDKTLRTVKRRCTRTQKRNCC